MLARHVSGLRPAAGAGLLTAALLLSACATPLATPGSAPAEAGPVEAAPAAPDASPAPETVAIVTAFPPGQTVTADTVIIKDKPRREQPTFAAHAVRGEVGKHVTAMLPGDVLAQFDMVVYVSKAGKGPIAQHAFFYTKDAAGTLVPGRVWAVSTGREKRGEMSKGGYRVNTDTPDGVYHFDMGRFTRLHRSRQWNADMPYAMFFSALATPNQGGFAIHAAGSGAIWKLGQRASAGCIRLHPSNAKALFNELLESYKGTMTRLAPGASTFTPVIALDPATGLPVQEPGIRALLIVEDNDGAALAAQAESAVREAAAGEMRAASAEN